MFMKDWSLSFIRKEANSSTTVITFSLSRTGNVKRKIERMKDILNKTYSVRNGENEMKQTDTKL